MTSFIDRMNRTVAGGGAAFLALGAEAVIPGAWVVAFALGGAIATRHYDRAAEARAVALKL